MTVGNLQSNEQKFRKVMSNKYGLVFDSPQDTTDVRRMLLSEMKSTASARPNDNIQTLNTAVLNATRDAVLRSHRTAAAAAAAAAAAGPPSIATNASNASNNNAFAMMPTIAMARDRDVYGAREVQVMSPSLLPMESVSPGSRADVNLRYDVESQRYDAPTMPISESDVNRQTQTVTAMDSGEFESRLADRVLELKQQMQQQQQQNVSSMGPFVVQPPPDTLAVVRRAQEEADEFRRSSSGVPIAPVPFTSASGAGTSSAYGHMIPHPSAASLIPGGPLMSTRMDSIIATPTVTQVVHKYILMNGSDRNVSNEPYRYQFTVKTGGNVYDDRNATLQSNYKNVAWLEVTRVIVPQEIMSAIGIGSAAASPSGNYNTEFSFAYPYLLLQIEGMNDVCDGTNDALRNSFTSLVYVTEYKAPNGRGYVSLAPGQMERKTYMSPIATLPDMKISLRKPNGTLFNNSKDTYTVGGSLPSVYNEIYVRIPIDQFFDRNEMWLGDNVTITGLVLHATDAANNAAVSALQAYLTQTAGLEIVDLPASNSKQYYNGIYVKIPGLFNQAAGTVQADASITNLMNTGGFTITHPGIVLNTSLQVVVMMTAGIVQGAREP